MKEIDISRAYQLIYKIASRSAKFTDPELSHLSQCIVSGNADLSIGEHDFIKSLKRLEDAVLMENNEEIAGELILLRLSAMNMSADLDNLVDAISDIFKRKSIGNTNKDENSKRGDIN